MKSKTLSLRIKRVDGTNLEIAALLAWFQLETLPVDPVVEPDQGYWWIAYLGKEPIGFIGFTDYRDWPKTGYLSRVGVLSNYRGYGLQKRLMARCERGAKALGYLRMISTTYCNPPSANSFIAREWRTYEPTARWGAVETIYWIKELST